MSGPFHRQLGLPVRGASRRVTRREHIAPGGTLTLMGQAQPGAILHWWLTYGPIKQEGRRAPGHDLRIRVFYDGNERPAVDVSWAQFAMILLDRNVYRVDSAAIEVLPKNALNCYLPMPFERIRFELVNEGPQEVCIWFMADWQAYGGAEQLTPLRLHVVHRAEFPAPPAGSMLMADLSGEGFIAGLAKAVRVKDNSDAWFHSGGDLWLLDGQTSPRAIRGIGGEDVFSMSYGVHDVQTDWVGAPHIHRPPKGGPRDEGYECVMYRFFGPDPVWFDTSAVVRFGTKANDIETVVYAYLDAKPAPAVLTPQQWLLAGPFECNGFEDFDRSEWAEGPPADWPKSVRAEFGRYTWQGRTAEFALPIRSKSEHGWCDLARHFRGLRTTNDGTQPVDVSAYAVGEVRIDKAGPYVLRIGYDDWCKVWLGPRCVHSGRHDAGFAVEEIPVELDSGACRIRVKLSNANNRQWRLWAFNLILEPR